MSTMARAAFVAHFFIAAHGISNDYQACDYNGKAIRYKREWSNQLMKATWEDGVSDTYRMISRTTNTTATWKDSRGGKWSSLDYAPGMILINSSNKNTIIFNGTRKICLQEWLGVCLGSP